MSIKVIWQYFKFLLRGGSAPGADSFNFIQPGMLVFDVGANRGNYSRLFASKGARVISVEPQQDCVSFMKMRFAFSRKIQIVPSGAGSTPGEQTFFISNADSISSMNPQWIDKVKSTRRFAKWQVEWKKPVTVKITTLDHLIEKYGTPAYIKIDVEGFEMEVLRGLTVPVKHISFEYTLPEMQSEAIACVDLLSALGPYVFKSELNASNGYVSREEILREIHEMSVSGELHNGDIFARLQ
jgi:FkbM family methyltransferase